MERVRWSDGAWNSEPGKPVVDVFATCDACHKRALPARLTHTLDVHTPSALMSILRSRILQLVSAPAQSNRLTGAPEAHTSSHPRA